MSRMASSPVIALTLLLPGASLASAPAPDITGQYNVARSGMIVSIAACDGGHLCGRIAGLGTLAATDANNPVPGLQGRRLCGVAVLDRLEWQNGFWSAELYEAKNGTNYAITFVAADGGALRVTGHSGHPILSRTYKRPVELWERVPSPPVPCGPTPTS